MINAEKARELKKNFSDRVENTEIFRSLLSEIDHKITERASQGYTDVYIMLDDLSEKVSLPCVDLVIEKLSGLGFKVQNMQDTSAIYVTEIYVAW